MNADLPRPHRTDQPTPLLSASPRLNATTRKLVLRSRNPEGVKLCRAGRRTYPGSGRSRRTRRRRCAAVGPIRTARPCRPRLSHRRNTSCTSRPKLVRSRITGASRNLGLYLTGHSLPGNPRTIASNCERGASPRCIPSNQPEVARFSTAVDTSVPTEMNTGSHPVERNQWDARKPASRGD